MKFRVLIALTAATILGATNLALADTYSQAEVRKIDADSGRVTLRHGPIDNLKMPPMTMVFRVTGDASLDGLEAGDQVEFRADKEGSNYVVTDIRKAE